MKNKTEVRKLETVAKITSEIVLTSYGTNIKKLNAQDVAIDDIDTSNKGICNSIVSDYIGVTDKNLDIKFRQMCNDNGIWFKAKKGVCIAPNDSFKHGRTAGTVVSAVKRFIKAGNVIDKTTTYSSIKEDLKVEITPEVKAVKEWFSKLTTADKQQAKKLLDAFKVAKAEELKQEQKEFLAKKEAKKNAEILKKTTAIISKSKPVRNKILNKAFG